ncbi:cysteine desulfuration protein SufE [Brachybacterium endophyticum]|uniref:Cysteine desulfuration protein SufE n=1 Tax=Brachybacterium endophyticum TaxID=2182385 RepID=A0A2U2RN90_9MICO|nr:SufE family protein [Brachybacterium endophyticum]PWH07333.1 cysteine desulfuration protein SufE [Brachybacterium endophyticum]
MTTPIAHGDGSGADGASAPLPPAFAQVVEDFQALAGRDRLQLLLEFADGLPDLPERYADHPELLEPVPECQTPIFLITEVDGEGEQAPMRLFFSAPPEAPTTRGFAGILAEGLEGLTVGEVLAVPADVTETLGLAEVVSPLRLRGMGAMLGRIKRQLGEKAGI